MRKLFICVVAALVAVSLAVPALAQNKGAGKYAIGIFERLGNATDFTMPGKAKGKVQIKPSKKGGDGGWTVQLNVKGIDCAGAPGGNDSGPGTCGPKGAAVTGHILELNTFVIGALGITIPLEFQIEKGKTTFFSSGKNKTGVGEGGSQVTLLFNTVLGIDGVRLHEPGSDPGNGTTGCGVIPPPAGTTCLDGATYALGGILVGEDPDLTCSTTAECDNGGAQPALICGGQFCEIETCTVDADCDQDGGGSGGTGQCDCGSGFCCDPVFDAGCAAICP